MPLNLINVRPGFNKQITDTAAEGQYVDGDFVRFRSGLPEKIGGWEKLTTDTLVGVARAQHQWTDLDGRIYSAIGTNKGLFIYYEGSFYDITPLLTKGSNTFDSTNGSTSVVVNENGHNLQPGDLITFSNVTLPGGGVTSFVNTDFTDNVFEVKSTTVNTLTITMPSSETGTGMSASATSTLEAYEIVGPTFQSAGYGFGAGIYGGVLSSYTQNTLNGGIDSVITTITLNDSSAFPSSGTVLIGSELITYTGNAANQLTGCTRGASGTTAASHTNGDTVSDATDFVGWGEASPTTTAVVDPGLWSLDNFGETLVATIHNQKTFIWQPIHNTPNALNTRATLMSGAPTQSVMTIVSDQDRHLIHLGTQTVIGNSGTQDKMFIRFSSQENYNEYEPTSINTAGTLRLDGGTEIRAAIQGKDYILILTDTSAYTLQYVGTPFTFSLRKVGSNCGCIGMNAVQFKDGIVYWMDDSGGFNYFDGTVKTLECTVEDFVFTQNNPGDLGLNYNAGKLVYAGNNCLFGEVTWYYPATGSDQINRAVVFNRGENTWTTMSLARTTQRDANLYDKPYKTSFNKTGTPTFPVIQGVSNVNGATTYWEHETGTDQVEESTTTAVTAFIETGDFMLHVEGDGELFTKIRRFIPDFKRLVGGARITINLKNYPTDTASSSSLGPFDITNSTDKVDTRARGRAASLKIENVSSGQTWRFGTFRADVQPDGRR